jgi:hypothetical protein
MSSHPHSEELPPPVVMLGIVQGYWASRAVYVAAKLGIADLLESGPRPCAELARVTETHEPTLYRVLRALAGIGILQEETDGSFALTPIGATLRSDVPGSLRHFAIEELGENHYPAWEKVLYSVKTGGIAFNQVYGKSKWQYMTEHPDEASIFNAAMSSFSFVVAGAIVEAYDFSASRTIVDVGGGDGSLLTTILKANGHARGILADLPHVAEQARGRIAAEGLAERCAVSPGDFFREVPSADTCILKWIVHDWDDDRSIAILRNCREALTPGGKVLLIEAVVEPGPATAFSKLMDLNMLVMTGGRERTEPEYRALLQSAGLTLTRIVPTHTAMSVIEASR